MARFPKETQGQPGRANRLVERLRAGDLEGAGGEFYNSLEAPAHNKYPILKLYQEFLTKRGPIGLLMSGSGSTTFSLWSSKQGAQEAERSFRAEFGETGWTAVGCL
jgi:4-diphosphocytidyl-2C-methyl-D-erythritol kinase